MNIEEQKISGTIAPDFKSEVDQDLDIEMISVQPPQPSTPKEQKEVTPTMESAVGSQPITITPTVPVESVIKSRAVVTQPIIPAFAQLEEQKKHLKSQNPNRFLRIQHSTILLDQISHINKSHENVLEIWFKNGAHERYLCYEKRDEVYEMVFEAWRRSFE